MTDASELRILFGLGPDVISDEALEIIIAQAQAWCDEKAAGYGITPPDSAVVLMAQVYLRQNLDLRGIKPSSISMPDLSMSTDLRSVCDALTDQAASQIKSAAFRKGKGFRHIRSGKVARWQ